MHRIIISRSRVISAILNGVMVTAASGLLLSSQPAPVHAQAPVCTDPLTRRVIPCTDTPPPPGAGGNSQPEPEKNGRICVSAFDDLNFNGAHDPGEPLLGGGRVFVVSAATGATTIIDLLASGPDCAPLPGGADYTGSEIPPSGFSVSGSDSFAAHLDIGGTVNVVFANTAGKPSSTPSPTATSRATLAPIATHTATTTASLTATATRTATTTASVTATATRTPTRTATSTNSPPANAAGGAGQGSGIAPAQPPASPLPAGLTQSSAWMWLFGAGAAAGLGITAWRWATRIWQPPVTRMSRPLSALNRTAHQTNPGVDGEETGGDSFVAEAYGDEPYDDSSGDSADDAPSFIAGGFGKNLDGDQEYTDHMDVGEISDDFSSDDDSGIYTKPEEE